MILRSFCTSGAFTACKNITKIAFLSRRRILLVKLLHEQNTSHKDHFTPKHAAFEQSAACLSVFLELFPGVIPFAIL